MCYKKQKTKKTVLKTHCEMSTSISRPHLKLSVHSNTSINLISLDFNDDESANIPEPVVCDTPFFIFFWGFKIVLKGRHKNRARARKS